MASPASDIGNRLRKAREARGLSQRSLSEKTGLTQAMISKIEAGRVDARLSTVVTLARALSLEVELVPKRVLPAVSVMISSYDEDDEYIKQIKPQVLRVSDYLREYSKTKAGIFQKKEILKKLEEYMSILEWIGEHGQKLTRNEAAEIVRSMRKVQQAGSKIEKPFLDRELAAVSGIKQRLENAAMSGRQSEDQRPAYSLESGSGDE